MTKQGFYGAIGFGCLLLAVGIVGGIDQGAPLGNFVYAIGSVIAGFVAFCKGGMIE